MILVLRQPISISRGIVAIAPADTGVRKFNDAVRVPARFACKCTLIWISDPEFIGVKPDFILGGVDARS